MADKSITKTELVASIASATGQSQSAVSSVLDSLFATVSEAVAKGNKVSIPGWLSFEQVETSARTGRNPQTGEEIAIPAGKRVKVGYGSGEALTVAVDGAPLLSLAPLFARVTPDEQCSWTRRSLRLVEKLVDYALVGGVAACAGGESVYDGVSAMTEVSTHFSKLTFFVIFQFS